MATANQVDLDLWALWPDSVMCELDEIEEFLRPPCARSDDYQVVSVLEYDDDGSPSKWEPR